MLYIFSQEELKIPEGVKIHIRSRIVTVEGPRGTITTHSMHLQHDRRYTLLWKSGKNLPQVSRIMWSLTSLAHCRQAHQRSFPLGRDLHSPIKRNRPHRDSPWLTKERRYSPNSQVHHQQPHHWRNKGLQVQDAIRLRTFPYQRQHREEQGDWPE